MIETPILDVLKKIGGADAARFCMPGHKGKAGFFGAAVNAFDITELPGADNLYMPRGAIAKSQRLYAQAIGAQDSFFLVNGSSQGVAAAVLSVTRPKEKILAARDIHVSAVSAFILAGVEAAFVQPSSGGELPCVVTPWDVEAAARAHPDAKALYLTYPNYYGLCCDLNEICKIAHQYGMKVICDAAHAAAFDWSDLMPVSPAAAGCDIWTTSLHKTAPAMNQCAVLSTGQKSGIDPELVRSRLNLTQTTSPSYVLLGSIDYALAYLRDRGRRALDTAVALVEENIRQIEALGGYRCVTKDAPITCGAYDRDILKLVIDVSDRGVSGFGAAAVLEKSGVYVEAADASHILLLCGVMDGAEDFARLKAALRAVTGANYHVRGMPGAGRMEEIYGGPQAAAMRKAAFAPRRSVPMMQSAGQVAAVAVGAYPPGVPVILPGQVIGRAALEYLARLKGAGHAIFGSDGNIDVVEVE